jgi:hypothetical protein
LVWFIATWNSKFKFVVIGYIFQVLVHYAKIKSGNPARRFGGALDKNASQLKSIFFCFVFVKKNSKKIRQKNSPQKNCKKNFEFLFLKSRRTKWQQEDKEDEKQFLAPNHFDAFLDAFLDRPDEKPDAFQELHMYVPTYVPRPNPSTSKFTTTIQAFFSKWNKISFS